MDQLHGITTRYRGLQEENRSLYNQIQDLRGNIRVFCRVRPPGATGDDSPSCVDAGVDSEVAVYDPARKSRRTFKFDKVFPPRSSQAEVTTRGARKGGGGGARCFFWGVGMLIFGPQRHVYLARLPAPPSLRRRWLLLVSKGRCGAANNGC